MKFSMRERRQVKNSKQITAKKIALVGTKAGVGVTHTGILIAEFLKEKMGARTAFLEMNHHGHMAELEKLVYGYSSQFFSFHGVDYYKETEKEKIDQLSIGSYDYLILDFGTQKKKEEELINQCDKKILIGNLNLWEWQEYVQAAKHFEMLSLGGEERYLVNFGEQKLVSKMGKMLKRNVYFLGYQPLGVPLSTRVENFFDTLV